MPPGDLAPGDRGAVIVTGGASGLGRAIAESVRQHGWWPVVLDLNPPPQEIEYEHVDLADARDAEQAVRRVGERHGRLRAVVTAAGTDACGTLDSVSGEAWDRVVAVNLLGTAAVARAALAYFEDGAGRIVTVASTLGLRAMSDATAYCASKFGVIGFSRSLAAELAGRVGVTCLIPGGMQTSFFDGREERYKPPSMASLAEPAEVAAAVAFALDRPAAVELRELVICPSTETSWP
ncbi:MAG TPA: SDR family oxidoreductase [Solirubrobacteraceae bacterium]|nr:SDR family oxidoreductase [Solirubrobacteraceae bacterium]